MVSRAKRFTFVSTNSFVKSCHPPLACLALTCQGVQLLLDGVLDYLPNPLEVPNYALDTAKNEEKVMIFIEKSFNFEISIILNCHRVDSSTLRSTARTPFLRTQYHQLLHRPSSSYRSSSSAAQNLPLWLWLSNWKKESSDNSRT